MKKNCLNSLNREDVQHVLDNLVTSAAAARFLNWKPQQISLYLSRNDFPEPLKLDGRSVWLWKDIKEFKKEYDERQIRKLKKRLKNYEDNSN